MTDNRILYDALASVMTYPNAEFAAGVDACIAALAGEEATIREKFDRWAALMNDMSLEEKEESYARTFDLSPKCTLELGWHLFGETYDRGTFLVWMREQLETFSLQEASDLPDHIRHVLPVLARMDRPDGDKFSCACVLPALETVRDGLKGMDSPYEALLDTICDWLESRHGAAIHEKGSLPILTHHEELLHAEDL